MSVNKRYVFGMISLLDICERHLLPYLDSPLSNIEALIMGDVLNYVNQSKHPGITTLLGVLPRRSAFIDYFIDAYEKHIINLLKSMDIEGAYMVRVYADRGYILNLEVVRFDNAYQPVVVGDRGLVIDTESRTAVLR